MRVQHVSGQYGTVVSVGLAYAAVRFDGELYASTVARDAIALVDDEPTA